MEFYVGWSHSDALYSDFFHGCPMLISAVPENKNPLKKFQHPPKKLIIDCGSVYYVKQKTRPLLRDIFDLQLSMIDGAKNDMQIYLVHFDEPLMYKKTYSDRYYAIERTIFNAYEFLQLFNSHKLPHNVIPMGVIQGFDYASIQYSAQELMKMGYPYFGIGSLLSRHPKLQIAFIQQAANIVGADRLHVFGVTGLRQMKSMFNLKIASFDSTRPTMAAAYYQVFYSNPFRTYLLSKCRIKKSGTRIERALDCECPVCRQSPNDILIPSPRKYMKLRSIHNYYHLKRTIENLI